MFYRHWWIWVNVKQVDCQHEYRLKNCVAPQLDSQLVKNDSIKQAVFLQPIAQMIRANARMLWRITELMSELNSRAESRWDPSMYLSAWNDGWLPVGWRNTNSLQLDWKKSSLCMCASNSRELHTYFWSEDELNILHMNVCVTFLEVIWLLRF